MGRPQGRHSSRKISADKSYHNSTPSKEMSLPRVMAGSTCNVDPESSSPGSPLHATLATPNSMIPDPQCGQGIGRLAFGVPGIYSMDCIDFSNLNEVRASVQSAPRSDSTSDQPCSCASRFYGALETLSNLPSRLEGAILNARQASKAVYEMLECSRCGIPALELLEARQAPRYHMVIMAASIFPALVAAYHKVENLADAEVAEADKNGRQLSFELGKYGGLWGPLSKGNRTCEEYYDDLTVDTSTWKTTIRALLRADIYGFDLPSHGENDKASYHHKGLWDFVQDMIIMSTLMKGNTEKKAIGNFSIATPGGPGLALQDGLDGGLEDGADLVIAIKMAHRSLLKLTI